jgi:HJR/Mrr/RecB family endonuclease
MAAIDTMTGLEFERCVAKLLKVQGFEHVRLTEEYDLGVDIIGEKNGIIWGIQAKRYTSLVGANAVRQAVAALKYYGCDRAMVVTNSYYSRVATELARTNNCRLIDRAVLIKLF